MPSFSLALHWTRTGRPERVGPLLRELLALDKSPKPSIWVYLSDTEARVEPKLETPGYPRQSLQKLKRDVESAGGELIELWQRPKPDRDAFRSPTGGGKAKTYAQAERAAEDLALHVGGLPQTAAAPAPSPAKAAPPKVMVPPPPPAAPSPAPALVPPPPPVEEVRHSPRYATNLEVHFATDRDFVVEHATNISNGGLFVRTAHRPPPGDIVTLELVLPNGEKLEGRAVVVHHREGPEAGLGLAFVKEDAQFEQRLDAYLASLAGKP